MKVTHILCAILACASLSFEARATASSEDGRPSRPEANAGQASGRTAPGQDASAKPEGTHDREPARARARTGGGSTGGGSTGSGSPGGVSKARDAAAAASPRRGSVTPPRSGVQGGPARAARGNADRLNSMLNARAHGRLARQPSRPAGTARAVARGPEVRGPRDAGPAGQPKLATSNSPASPAARPAPNPRNSAIGGPHAQTLGRVGGPTISRTTHSATVDGNQFHHKF